MIYPWQSNEWRRLWELKIHDRLPHAFLFVGIAGIGKRNFAEHFSQALFCQQVDETGEVCNRCHACHLVAAKTHPNVFWVEPEKNGHAIKIDQIRASIDFINHSSLQGKERILIINPATNMNRNAANALLKTLEEPAPGAMIVLISDQSKPLPATILSRCQRFTFNEPQRELALSWLKKQYKNEKMDIALLLNLANGAPLIAQHFFENEVLSMRENLFQIFYSLRKKQADPIQSAESMLEVDLVQVLDFFLSWMIDLLRLQLGGETIVNSDYKTQLIELMKYLSVKNHLQFIDYLRQVRQQISIGLNLNKQLLLEDICIRWLSG